MNGFHICLYMQTTAHTILLLRLVPNSDYKPIISFVNKNSNYSYFSCIRTSPVFLHLKPFKKSTNHPNIYYIQASIFFLSTATIVLSYYTFFSDYEVAPFITHSIKNLTSISTSEVIISPLP